MGCFPQSAAKRLRQMRPAHRGRLAPPGKRPAFAQCRFGALQLGGELEPLLGEIQQDSRVLGGVGRLGQLLASRRVRTTFSRIGGIAPTLAPHSMPKKTNIQCE
jgi:hypothetical protein